LNEVSNFISVVLLLGFGEWAHVDLNFSSSLTNFELLDVSTNCNLIGSGKGLRSLIDLISNLSIFILRWNLVFWDQNLSKNFIVLSSSVKRII
jgi:hypothetical protein